MDGLRYLLVPWVSPLAPAMLMGVSFYHETVDNWGKFWAAVVGVAVVAGIEFSGQYIAKGVALFFADSQWVRFAVCIVGLVVYSVVGIMQFWGTPWMILFVLVSFVYLVIGLVESRGQTRDEERADTELEHETIRLKKNLLNAETRNIKAGVDFRPVRGGVPSGTNVKTVPENPNPSKRDLVWGWLTDNVGDDKKVPSIRTIQNALEELGHGTLSTSTLSNHVRKWKDQEGIS